ncbi:recombination protein NinB [Shinella zoogloeoides]|uniref:recombination protein NinB n=1 Tax=Shinella zoogloeoides TaxID=352475 RepID=UPI00299E6F74|nr:recombination protein NinB [Shinella zoogloeoides]WPE22448.1 hypothetical protein ShzoTeo12_36640 [Shinella zoogloeoides]
MTTRAAVTINTREDREKVARWAEKVPEGTIVEFRKKTRSHEQNAKMHAMLAEVSEQVDWYGSKLDPEDWKTMFTASLRKANVIPGIDAGTVVPLGLSTSAMTVEEMSNLIELIYAFGAERNVAFKEPQESNTNSAAADQSPSGQSPDADEVPPPSSQQDGGEASSPSASSPSSPSTEMTEADRALFMECAAKLFAITVQDDLDGPAKRGVLVSAKDTWKEAIRPELHPKLASIFLAADSIITGKNTNRAGAIREVAGWLECAPSEIGGDE